MRQLSKQLLIEQNAVTPVADLGGDPGVQWNPPFGRVLRNYEGFVVVLRVIGALAIVYVTGRP